MRDYMRKYVQFFKKKNPLALACVLLCTVLCGQFNTVPAYAEETEPTAEVAEAAPDPKDAFIRHIYQCALGREPVYAEAKSLKRRMTEDGYSGQDFVKSLFDSDEYRLASHDDSSFAEGAISILNTEGDTYEMPYTGDRNVYLSGVLNSDKFRLECENAGVVYQSYVPPSGDNITWIGDSYSVIASGIIAATFPGVDIHAAYSKHTQMDAAEGAGGASGLSILNSIASQGGLRQYVVFALGTNDPIPSVDTFSSYIDTVMAIAGPDRTVVFVTPYTMDAASGASNYVCEINAIRLAKGRYTNVRVADWADYCQPYLYQFFAGDTIHPISGGGMETWVGLIAGALAS